MPHPRKSEHCPGYEGVCTDNTGIPSVHQLLYVSARTGSKTILSASLEAQLQLEPSSFSSSEWRRIDMIRTPDFSLLVFA